MATGPTPEAHTPSRRRGAKAASAPRPLEAGVASSSVPDAEATSAAPAYWVRGGGMGALNKAVLDVQAKLRTEAEALKRCNEAFLDSREAIRISFLLFFISIFLHPSWGRASALTGCSPKFWADC